jgi:hypothetical protein
MKRECPDDQYPFRRKANNSVTPGAASAMNILDKGE